MHAIRCGLPGQAFATAASNESGGRKSRIRRSKEERKAMVESFIKKYQDSNNGSFPSLNLAHKEVGGSFYMVREIVREIIQENRILAPPKASTNENIHSEILDLHPRGSISAEPPYNLTESERVDTDTHLVPDRYQLMGKESTARSSIHFHETNPGCSADKQILEGVSEVAENNGVPDGTCATNDCHDESNTEQLMQPHLDVLNNKKVSNGVAMPELNQHFDKQEVPSYENDKIVDKHIEDGERDVGEVILKALNAEKLGGKDVERLEAVTSHMDSDVVVEKFPLRPITKMDGESSKVQMQAESSIDVANVKDETMHQYKTKELSKRHRDEKVVQNLQDGSVKCSKHYLASELSPPEVSDPELQFSRSSERLISQDVVSGRNSGLQDDNSPNKKGNPTLDRINLDTWERSADQTERNPFLALVKALVTAFTKLWSE